MNHEIDNKDAVVLRPVVRIAADTNHILTSSYRRRAIYMKTHGAPLSLCEAPTSTSGLSTAPRPWLYADWRSLSCLQFIFFISIPGKKVNCNKLFLDTASFVELKASAKLRDLPSAFYNRLCVLSQNKSLNAASIVERETLTDPQFKFRRSIARKFFQAGPSEQKLSIRRI